MDYTLYYAHRPNCGWLLILQLEEGKEEITKAVRRCSAGFTGNTLKQNSMLKKKKVMNTKEKEGKSGEETGV